MNAPSSRHHAGWYRLMWLLAPTVFFITTVPVLVGAVKAYQASGMVFVPIVAAANLAFWGYCGWRHGQLSLKTQTLEGTAKRAALRNHAIVFSACQLLVIPVVVAAAFGTCSAYMNRVLS